MNYLHSGQQYPQRIHCHHHHHQVFKGKQLTSLVEQIIHSIVIVASRGIVMREQPGTIKVGLSWLIYSCAIYSDVCNSAALDLNFADKFRPWLLACFDCCCTAASLQAWFHLDKPFSKYIWKCTLLAEEPGINVHINNCLFEVTFLGIHCQAEMKGMFCIEHSCTLAAVFYPYVCILWCCTRLLLGILNALDMLLFIFVNGDHLFTIDHLLTKQRCTIRVSGSTKSKQ